MHHIPSSIYELRHAWYDGSWHIETVDNDSETGFYPSISVDKQNVLHVVYVNQRSHSLKHAWYDGGVWSIETIDEGAIDHETGIAIDNNNYMHVVYLDEMSPKQVPEKSNAMVKYAYSDHVLVKGNCDTDDAGVCFSCTSENCSGVERCSNCEVGECEEECGASPECDDKLVNSSLSSCSVYGESYFADVCVNCEIGEDTSVCRSVAYASDCTGDDACNGLAIGDPCGVGMSCDSTCKCVVGAVSPPSITIQFPVDGEGYLPGLVDNITFVVIDDASPLLDCDWRILNASNDAVLKEGSKPSVPNATTVVVSFTALVALGNYKAEVNCSDTDGEESLESASFLVYSGGAHQPIADANGPYSCYQNGLVGSGKHGKGFYGADSYDPDGDIVDYVWSISGIGDVANGEVVNYTCNVPLGSYVVNLTVVDSGGRSNSSLASLVVVQPGLANLLVKRLTTDEPLYAGINSRTYGTVSNEGGDVSSFYEVTFIVRDQSGNVVKTSKIYQDSLPASAFKDFSLEWVPPKEGIYNITLVVDDSLMKTNKTIQVYVKQQTSAVQGPEYPSVTLALAVGLVCMITYLLFLRR